MAFAIYNQTTNKVVSFINDEGHTPPSGYELVNEPDLPQGWTFEQPFSSPPTWRNLEFYNRFTVQEKIAFEMASVATTEQGAAIAVLLTTFLVNPVLWAADPAFIQGMNALVATGVLSSQRLIEVMDGYTFPE